MIAVKERDTAIDALETWVKAEVKERTAGLQHTVVLHNEEKAALRKRIAELEAPQMDAPPFRWGPTRLVYPRLPAPSQTSPTVSGATPEQLAEALLIKVLGRLESAIVGDRRGMVTINVKPAQTVAVVVDPVNHGKPWGEADETRLVRLYRFGLSLPELARVFQRYEDAIVLRLQLLNHSHRVSASVPENPSDKWYADKRRIFFSTDGTRTASGNCGLTSYTLGSNDFYKPHIAAAADQPVRDL